MPSIPKIRLPGPNSSPSTIDELEAVATMRPHEPPPDNVRQLKSPLLASMRNGDYLNEARFEPLRWVVPAIVPEGLTMLVGGPKLGKSWLAYSVALAVASGGRVLDQIDVGAARPVLYLALEDSDRRLQDRGRTLLGPRERFPQLFDYMLTIEPGTVLDVVSDYVEHVSDHPVPPLIVLDTLGKVMPNVMRNETTFQRDYRTAGSLANLAKRRPGTGIVVIHHDRKAAADDFVDTISGTNGIAAGVDTISVLVRQRMETSGLLKLTGRDVDENEYAISFDAGRWSLCGDLSEAAERARSMRATLGLEQRAADVLAVVIRTGGCTPDDVARELKIDTKTANTYLGRLVTMGRIQRLKRGVYAP